jgi:hypothetical protein
MFNSLAVCQDNLFKELNLTNHYTRNYTVINKVVGDKIVKQRLDSVGNYSISKNAEPLLAFNDQNDLQPSALKSYIDNTISTGNSVEEITGTDPLASNVNVSYVSGTSHSLAVGTILGFPKTIINRNENVYTNFAPSLTFYSVPVLVSAYNPNNKNAYFGGPFFASGIENGTYIFGYNTESKTFFSLGTGLDGECSAIAVDPATNDVYVGGSFTQAGGVACSNIARFDGSVWHNLGTGLNGSCYSLAIKDGLLYAGGNFSEAGGVACSNIARWTVATSVWDPLGMGVDGSVRALAIASNGNVYIGGSFTSAIPVPYSSRFAKWNGTEIVACGTGVSGPVRCIAIANDGIVYLGGEFLTAGGVAVSRFASWNDATGVYSAFAGGFNNNVNSISLDYSTGSLIVYVGGQFTTANTSMLLNRFARWGGSSWKPIGQGVAGSVAVSVSSIVNTQTGDIFLTGNFSSVGGGTGYNSLAQVRVANLNEVSLTLLAPTGIVYNLVQFANKGQSVIINNSDNEWVLVGPSTNAILL